MPLTFAEAKLQYNPDPDWEPKRGSSEYYEILALMRISGATFHSSIDVPKPKPLLPGDILHNGRFKHPVTVPDKPTPGRTAISKEEFLRIASNRKAPKAREQTIVDETYVVVSRDTMKALKTQAQNVLDAENRIKTMSKQEFLTMAENREYVKQHILLNKK